MQIPLAHTGFDLSMVEKVTGWCIVMFSGGAKTDDAAVLDEVRAICAVGGSSGNRQRRFGGAPAAAADSAEID
jgi:hypothetical protein